MFNRLKQFVGMVGIEFEVIAPFQLPSGENHMEGTIVVNAKSDQLIKEITLRLMEERTTGRGDEERQQEIRLGYLNDLTERPIKAGERLEVPFSFYYNRVPTSHETLVQSGGALGVLGQAAKFADNERVAFYLEAVVDVKGAAFDPSKRYDVTFVG